MQPPIKVEHHPSAEKLMALGVEQWPTWSEGISRFPWTYGETEMCYLLAGEVIVTPDGGEPVTIAKGDLVTLPAGLSCTWDIKQSVKKHYSFA